MNYKKRRVQPGPNKNEEKIRRNKIGARTLESYFNGVERLVIDFRWTSKHGAVLGEERGEYTPGDKISFMIPCPGGCGNGQINFERKITDLVNERKTDGEGRAQCAIPLYPSGEICDSEVKCRLSVVYKNSPPSAVPVAPTKGNLSEIQ